MTILSTIVKTTRLLSKRKQLGLLSSYSFTKRRMKQQAWVIKLAGLSAFALVATGIAYAAGPFYLVGRGPVSVSIKPPTEAEGFYANFVNDTNINVGADIYDSAGDHLYGITLRDKGEFEQGLVAHIVHGRTYKIQMRCNDGNPFNREKCRAHATYFCYRANKVVSCGPER